MFIGKKEFIREEVIIMNDKSWDEASFGPVAGPAGYDPKTKSDVGSGGSQDCNVAKEPTGTAVRYVGPIAGPSYDSSIMGQVNRELGVAQREAHRLAKLEELSVRLHNNPEVTRILQLMRDLGL